jgi:hypothetical protein
MNKEPDFECQFDKLECFDDWTVVKKGNSPWNKYMGSSPSIHLSDNDNSFFRLDCDIYKDGQILITGIKSIDTFSDGKLEIKARFKGGNSSWPAIWLKNYTTDKYYEIDICEYFERRPWCKTGLFMPRHLKWGLNRFFRPKKHPRIKRNDWNVFTCEWDDKHILITLNNKKVLEYKNNGDSNYFPQTIKDRTFSLILSMQYGHSWCLPKCKKQLPLYIDIDYVKYWKNN